MCSLLVKFIIIAMLGLSSCNGPQSADTAPPELRIIKVIRDINEAERRSYAQTARCFFCLSLSHVTHSCFLLHLRAASSRDIE